MCGIFGYIGAGEVKEALTRVIEGIKKLDYRGYDSAGVAAISQGKLVYEKKVGTVDELEEALKEKSWPSKLAITHTRWATHGKPTLLNAHPHLDSKGELALVHNGIIENHSEVRQMLEAKGVKFVSETDSETVSQLIGHFYEGDFLKAVQKSVAILKGAFALAAIHQSHPEEIICAAKECPLIIGLGKNETFISSDSNAFLKYTNKAIYLRSSEIAVVKALSIEIFDFSERPIFKQSEELKIASEEINKEGYKHYMKKEIFEQPQTLLYALASRFNEEYGKAVFDELTLSDEELLKIQRIVIIACGSSYHAGLAGAYLIEELARIPVQVEISSEYRYKNPIVQKGTLAIAISQSGETADTIAAMRELKEKGASIIGICNVQGSTISREVDSTLFLRAGPEIGVASTKAFMGQLTILALLTLRLARMRTMSLKEGQDFLAALNAIPSQIRSVLERSNEIESIALKYQEYDNFFYLGRRFMYPAALEGALKLKEIAYVNASGYPAGEMKHGPIALINERAITLAFCADQVTYLKSLSNLMEIKARNGKIIAIVMEGACEGIEEITRDVIVIPKTIDGLSIFPATVASQLFAYHFANLRGEAIDRPRNLAKSVTVE